MRTQRGVGAWAAGALWIGAGVTAALATGLAATPETTQAAATAQPTTPLRQDPDGSLRVKTISLEQAYRVIEAAQTKAIELGTAMDIAVVDRGGNLKAFARMDGAWIGSIDIAIKKAKTAAFFEMNTGDIGELSQPGEPLYMIEVSNEGLITFPGGVPITTEEGEVIGAIGVSGSTVENDHAVATAGANGAWNERR